MNKTENQRDAIDETLGLTREIITMINFLESGCVVNTGLATEMREKIREIRKILIHARNT